MKIVPCLFVAALLASGCTRIPYAMEVADMQGVARPYYQEDEAMVIRLEWDLARDEGKTFECSFVETFSGNDVWKGSAVAPKVEYGQKYTQLNWIPPMPVSGIKAKGGEYVANCNFGNEASLSVPVRVRTPFEVNVTDLNGVQKPYFANDEAVKLQVRWDLKHDAGKTVQCSIVNAYGGEVVWQGFASTPGIAPHQKFADVDWQPPFPAGGVKLKPGNYSANCNFNDEKSISTRISVTNVKSWP